MKCQDVFVEFYSFATSVKGDWGVERRYNPSVFKKYGAEKSLSWKVSSFQHLKNRTLTVFELQEWCWYQKKRIFVIYKVFESFLKFRNSEKNCAVWSFSFLDKNDFFSKKYITRKIKWISKKTLCYFVEH